MSRLHNQQKDGAFSMIAVSGILFGLAGEYIQGYQILKGERHPASCETKPHIGFFPAAA